MSAADDIGHGMHSAIGGFSGLAGALMVASHQSRQASQERQAHVAAAAAGARVGVLLATVSQLRESLEDAREDLALQVEQADSMRRHIARLTQERDALLVRRAA